MADRDGYVQELRELRELLVAQRRDSVRIALSTLQRTETYEGQRLAALQGSIEVVDRALADEEERSTAVDTHSAKV